jgi:Glycosyl hydrolase family 20, catalytic domain
MHADSAWTSSPTEVSCLIQRVICSFLPCSVFSNKNELKFVSLSFPKADILRTLEAMSYVKASTFHWHIVDSQSFPLVIPEFPELSAKGAYAVRSVHTSREQFPQFEMLIWMKQPDQVYTPADVQEIVAYAGAVSETEQINVIRVLTPGCTTI